MRDIKIIWDFRGDTAAQTAKHFIIHLKEYAIANNIPYLEIDVFTVSEMHTFAFMAVSEAYSTPIRKDLKPHRAELYNL